MADSSRVTETAPIPPKPVRPTWVMGHKNPDTDAICSALAYADFLRQTRLPDAIAACCGHPNTRTEWVLQKAGIHRPTLISDINLRAGDICRREVSTARATDSVIESYREMAARHYRSLPVIDDHGILVGMLALQDLLHLLIPSTEHGDHPRQVTALDRKDLADPRGRGRHHRRVGRVRAAVSHDGGGLLGTGHAGPHREHAEGPVAHHHGRPRRRATPRGRGRGPLSRHHEQLSSFRSDRPRGPPQGHDHPRDGTRHRLDDPAHPRGALDPQRRLDRVHLLLPRNQAAGDQGAAQVEPRPGPLSRLRSRDERLIGVFSRADLVNPERPRLILVDHNEFSQAVTGAEEAEIIEVLDHHRLSGNLVTKEPIQFINKTVGSTCTIVGSAFRGHGLEPSRGIAVCICAGIISDTLNLTSPTTTDEDRSVLEWASRIAGVDVDQFKEDFFSAGSVLRGGNFVEAVGSDRKEFEENGYRVSISQVEEIGFDYFWPAREALQEELRRLIRDHHLDLACLMITDITLNDSLLLIEAPAEIRQKIGYPRATPTFSSSREW